MSLYKMLNSLDYPESKDSFNKASEDMKNFCEKFKEKFPSFSEKFLSGKIQVSEKFGYRDEWNRCLDTDNIDFIEDRDWFEDNESQFELLDIKIIRNCFEQSQLFVDGQDVYYDTETYSNLLVKAKEEKEKTFFDILVNLKHLTIIPDEYFFLLENTGISFFPEFGNEQVYKNLSKTSSDCGDFGAECFYELLEATEGIKLDLFQEYRLVYFLQDHFNDWLKNHPKLAQEAYECYCEYKGIEIE